MYKLEKNLNRLNNGYPTYFLDPKEQRDLKSKLKKNEYNIYYPYRDSEKNIFYKDTLPEVTLYEIKTKRKLRHQDILGSIFSLGITSEVFGDILIIDNKYYIYVLSTFRNYFESNFLKVGNNKIELIELQIDTFKDYERSYEKIELIVSSNRIDTVISTLIHTGRKYIKDMKKNKEIILNYDFLKDISYKLKENDIFSIKRIGKYKYIGSIKTTKSGNIIIELLKYI